MCKKEITLNINQEKLRINFYKIIVDKDQESFKNSGISPGAYEISGNYSDSVLHFTINHFFFIIITFSWLLRDAIGPSMVTYIHFNEKSPDKAQYETKVIWDSIFYKCFIAGCITAGILYKLIFTGGNLLWLLVLYLLFFAFYMLLIIRSEKSKHQLILHLLLEKTG